MTRKDYERMVNIIAHAWGKSDHSHAAFNAMTLVAQSFADAAAIDNAGFKKDHFLMVVESRLEGVKES